MAGNSRTKRSVPVASAPVAALADVPVGPALATMLASLTLKELTGFETVLVLKARNRQSNHDRGMLLATIGEVMHRKDPDLGSTPDDQAHDGRLPAAARDGWDEVGANEIRAALMLTRRSANTLAGLARDLTERLPAVLQAMIDGVLDQPRARIFSEHTSLLSRVHAQAVVEALLPKAPKLTTAQLIDAIAKAAIELDPDWARRRYERALRGRRVEGVIGPDGTATLSGHQLPADQVAAACDRLDAIARQLKRAGHPHPINHIRADIFLGKLTGAYAGMDDEQLLAHLLNTMPTSTPDADSDAPADSDAQSDSADPATGHPHPGTDTSTNPNSSERDGTDSSESPSGSGSDIPSGSGHGDDPPSGHDDDPPGGDDGDGDDGEDPDGPYGSDDDGPDGPDTPDGDPDPPDGAGGVVETDGEAATVGTVAAMSTVETANAVIASPGPSPPHTGADPPDNDGATGGSSDLTGHGHGPSGDGDGGGDDGRADDGGADDDGRNGGADDGNGNGNDGGRGVVRGRGLRLLTGLGTIAGVDRHASQLLGWGPLHAELARTVSSTPHASWWYVVIEPDGTPLDVGPIRRRPTQPWAPTPTPNYRDVEVWLQVTREQLAALLDQPPSGWEELLTRLAHRIANRRGGPPNGDPTDRLPNAALRRWIHIRDQACVFLGCRVAPHRCDQDHTIEHANGGPTSDPNLAPMCKADHLLRHQGGWSVTQHKPGHVTWTSPLGHLHERTPPPGPDQALPPMPNPTHPDDDLHVGLQFDLNATDWDTDTCLHTPQWTHQHVPRPESDCPPAPQPGVPNTTDEPDPTDDIPPF